MFFVRGLSELGLPACAMCFQLRLFWYRSPTEFLIQMVMCYNVNDLQLCVVITVGSHFEDLIDPLSLWGYSLSLFWKTVVLLFLFLQVSILPFVRFRAAFFRGVKVPSGVGWPRLCTVLTPKVPCTPVRECLCPGIVKGDNGTCDSVATRVRLSSECCTLCSFRGLLVLP